ARGTNGPGRLGGPRPAAAGGPFRGGSGRGGGGLRGALRDGGRALGADRPQDVERPGGWRRVDCEPTGPPLPRQLRGAGHLPRGRVPRGRGQGGVRGRDRRGETPDRAGSAAVAGGRVLGGGGVDRGSRGRVARRRRRGGSGRYSELLRRTAGTPGVRGATAAWTIDRQRL